MMWIMPDEDKVLRSGRRLEKTLRYAAIFSDDRFSTPVAAGRHHSARRAQIHRRGTLYANTSQNNAIIIQNISMLIL